MREDVTGQRFGRLTALHFVERRKRATYWRFACDCGGVIDAWLPNAKMGRTRSCGCFRKETATAQAIRRATHGKTHTPEYRSWSSLRGRCNNPNDKQYPDYGGRSIKVCERWNTSFDNFYADMGPRPAPRYSVERIDVNKGYEPSNCCWIPCSEQTRNTRANVRLTLFGQPMILADLALMVTLHASTVSRKLAKGLTPEEIYQRYARTRS
jgi:hypothetical protein